MLTNTRENSQALESEWELVQETQGHEKVLSVDCSNEEKLCRQLGISSFPAIRLHGSDGNQGRYRGPRKSTSILGFLQRTSRPVLSHVNGQNATNFQHIDDVVFIGYFPSNSKHLLESFTSLARKYHDRFSFALATGAQQKEQQQPTLRCYNNADGLHRTTAELSGSASIEAFINLCSTPLIPEMTRRNELSFYEVGGRVKVTGRGN